MMNYKKTALLLMAGTGLVLAGKHLCRTFTPPHVMATVESYGQGKEAHIREFKFTAARYNTTGYSTHSLIMSVNGEVRAGHFRGSRGARPAHGEREDWTITIDAVGAWSNPQELDVHTMSHGQPHRLFNTWRDIAPLVNEGQSFRITPQKPQLIGRALKHSGDVEYTYLSVLDGKGDMPSPDPEALADALFGGDTAAACWPVSAEWRGGSVCAQIAWKGQAPRIEDLQTQFNPRVKFPLAGEWNIQQVTASIRETGSAKYLMDLQIDLGEVPGHEDLFFLCDLTLGIDGQADVEIPLRRKTIDGRVYPVGVEAVHRAAQDGEAHTTASYVYSPELGKIVGFGTQLRLIDPVTLESEVIWESPPWTSADIPRWKSDMILDVDVSPDGKSAAFVHGRHRTLYHLDLDGNRPPRSIKVDQHDYPRTLKFTDDGERIILARYPIGHSGGTSQISVFSSKGLNTLNQFSVDHSHDHPGLKRQPIHRATACIISPEMERVACAYDCGCLRLYDVPTGKLLWEKPEVSRDWEFRPPGMAFENAGETLVTRTGQGIAILNSGSGAQTKNVPLDGWTPGWPYPSRGPFFMWCHDEAGSLLAASADAQTRLGPGKMRDIIVFDAAHGYTAQKRIPAWFGNGSLADRTELTPVHIDGSGNLFAMFRNREKHINELWRIHLPALP